MNRKDKIKALQAVRAGLLIPEDIRPAKIILAIQQEAGNGWEMKNESGEMTVYTAAEFEAMKSEFAAASDRRERCGMEPDKIICVVYYSECEPIK